LNIWRLLSSSLSIYSTSSAVVYIKGRVVWRLSAQFGFYSHEKFCCKLIKKSIYFKNIRFTMNCQCLNHFIDGRVCKLEIFDTFHIFLFFSILIITVFININSKKTQERTNPLCCYGYNGQYVHLECCSVILF